MNAIQIEKAFEKRGVSVEIHHSGISKSSYFAFQDKNGDDVKIRVSNHDLPASYSDRSHRCDVDFRFTDKISEVNTFIEAKTGATVVKTVKKPMSEEQIAFLESEAKSLGCTMETIKRIYGAK